MGRFLGRLLMCGLGGFAGSAAGFVLYQLRTGQADIDAGRRDITVAAPPITASLAALIGTLSGGPSMAFMTGAAMTATLGTSLDERVTGIAASQPTKATSTSSSHNSG